MPTSEEFEVTELEVNITEELTLAECSRPDDPVVESDRGWRPNPTNVKAYEARLLALRGALEAVDAQRSIQPDITAESQTTHQIGTARTRDGRE